MITLDLRKQDISVDELFEKALSEPMHIITKDGETFVLEPADEFEREVAELGQSQRFMDFLAERGKESGRTTLEEIEQRLQNTSE